MQSICDTFLDRTCFCHFNSFYDSDLLHDMLHHLRQPQSSKIRPLAPVDQHTWLMAAEMYQDNKKAAKDQSTNNMSHLMSRLYANQLPAKNFHLIASSVYSAESLLMAMNRKLLLWLSTIPSYWQSYHFLSMMNFLKSYNTSALMQKDKWCLEFGVETNSVTLQKSLQRRSFVFEWTTLQRRWALYLAKKFDGSGHTIHAICYLLVPLPSVNLTLYSSTPTISNVSMTMGSSLTGL